MKKRISITMLFLALFLLITNSNVYAKPNSKRLYGNSRYETSAAIVKDGWEKSEFAIIASGEGFADALSAAPLAKKLDAPIILTEGKNLNSNAKQQLQRLQVKNVIIVGGPGSISNNTENQIKNLGISTKRIYGKSRFDTSLEVAKEIGIKNGVIVTNGYGFADALSMAPIAANKQMPILLTPAGELPTNTKAFLSSNKYEKSYVIGGSVVVSNNIQSTLKNPKRLFGQGRYDTNAAILNEFKNDVDLNNLFLAAGTNYPDALSASALAAKNNSPIILSDGASINNNVMNFVKSNNAKFGEIIITGGTSVLNDVVVKSVEEGRNIGPVEIHYIDVGQGDSILIQQDGHNMLIDAGTNASENTVVNYLKSKGVTKLDYVIGTHPHEDHIGGLDKVIDNFAVNKVIMPKVTHTTQTFKDVITSIQNKGLKITVPTVGDKYSLGVADFTILAPNNSSYSNLNNYSIVIKLKFGNRAFIFTGDAESLSEGEILAKQLDITGDVLKLGHHGSKTSTSQNFLNKVNPKYAVVSCGKNNSYKHPHQETLNKLKAKNIKVYRTDETGTITATSNGSSLSFNAKQGSYIGGDYVAPKPKPKPDPKPDPKPVEQTVYITKTGKKFHRNGCRSLSKSKISISRSNAIKKGYSPCSVCKP
ncbi:cell wall-binding repeat-containing protein [Clostridium botulinum]|uniref:cell wall-binding repeat-containing protein n=1 Tax=Clostridium botulinum TaxID=1491 RepID=UPI003A8120A6